ncbi:MAG TPA: hypothetical protein VGB04_09145 [Allosphingosinicella sp.]|jgi:hypothetical protein
MRIISVLAVVAAAAMSGGVAVAKEKSAASAEKKICRTLMPAVGRIPEKRECKSKAEWEAADAESQNNAAKTLRSASGRN